MLQRLNLLDKAEFEAALKNIINLGDDEASASQKYLFTFHLTSLGTATPFLYTLAAKDKLDCLKRITSRFDEHLGLTLAFDEKHPESLEYYLNFLISAAKQPGLVREIFSILEMKSRLGHTLGHAIARHQDYEINQQFVNILNTLMLDGIYAHDVFNLLNSGYLYTVLDMAAVNSDHYVTRVYLDLLNDLFQKGISAADLYKLITHIDPSNKNIFDKIRSQSGDVILHESFNYLFARIIYAHLKTTTLSAEEYKQIGTKELKKAVLDHVCTLPEAEQEKALENILNRTTSLGRLFWVQRGPFEPHPTKGSLAIAIAKLDALKKAQKKLEDKVSDLIRANKTNALACYKALQEVGDTEKSPTHQITLLNLKDDLLYNLGMRLARNEADKESNKKACKYYFSLLKRLVLEANLQKDVYDLIASTQRTGWTLAYFLARYQSIELNHEFMELLTTLDQAGIPPRDIFRLFSQKANDGDEKDNFVNYGNIVAAYQNDDFNLAYLTTLSNFQKEHVASSEEIYELLIAKNANNCTTGIALAMSRGAECNKMYLTILTQLLKDRSASDICALLKIKSKKNRTFTMELAEKIKDAATIEQFLDLLSALRAAGSSNTELATLLTDGDEHKKDFVTLIKERHPSLADRVSNLLKDLLRPADNTEEQNSYPYIEVQDVPLEQPAASDAKQQTTKPPEEEPIPAAITIHVESSSPTTLETNKVEEPPITLDPSKETTTTTPPIAEPGTGTPLTLYTLRTDETPVQLTIAFSPLYRTYAQAYQEAATNKKSLIAPTNEADLMRFDVPVADSIPEIALPVNTPPTPTNSPDLISFDDVPVTTLVLPVNKAPDTTTPASVQNASTFFNKVTKLDLKNPAADPGRLVQAFNEIDLLGEAIPDAPTSVIRLSKTPTTAMLSAFD